MKNILDAPSPDLKVNPARVWARRIATGVEICLWMFTLLIAMLFKKESWEFSGELVILSYTALAVFYLLFTFLVTGANGKLQVWAAVGAGLAMSVKLAGSLFIIESWGGGHELLIAGYVAALVSALDMLYSQFKARRNGATTAFHWNVLARLVFVMVIL